VATSSQPLALLDPAQARVWRPRLLLALGAAAMVAGAFGPWLAGKLSGGSAGVALGGDGWLLVLAAGFAVAPALVGLTRGALGLWALLNALLGGFVCLVHSQQSQMDGFRNGWGLYVAGAGCCVLGLAGLQWLRAASRH
jgi:hypothetical protein